MHVTVDKRQINMRLFTRMTSVLVLCAFALNVSAQDTKLTVNVETAGTLPTLMTADQKSSVTELVLSGKLNGTDIKYIREMAGIDCYGDKVTGNSLTALDMSAADIVAGGDYYYYTYGTTDNVVGEFMFGECSQLESVKIPESTISIEWSAFSSCSGLTSFTVPDAVEVIDQAVFEGCTSMTEVVFGSSLKTLDGYAFEGCTSLQSAVLPEGLEELNEFAFSGCSSLTSVTIPSTLKKIGDFAFYDDSSLTSVEIKEGVENISYNSFSSCTALESIVIPESVTEIGESAFDGCSSLTNIKLPSNLTVISESMLSNCSALEYITIPESVKTISDMAFCYDESLKEITIPDAVEHIGGDAFFDNISLKTVNIGKGLVELGDDVFKFCEQLQAINVDSENTVYSSIDGVLFNKEATTLMFMPCAYGESYTVPDGVLEIGEAAFTTNMVLKSVTMNDDLKVIGADAFSFCDSLEYVAIGKNVETIGEDAFFSDDNIKEIHCRIETPLEIDSYTFYGPDKEVCVLYVPEGCVDKYKAADVWSDFLNIVEETTTGIKNISNEASTITINGKLISTGTEGCESYSVYTLDGRMVYSGNGNDVNVPANNVYIVKAGNKAIKIVL